MDLNSPATYTALLVIGAVVLLSFMGVVFQGSVQF